MGNETKEVFLGLSLAAVLWFFVIVLIVAGGIVGTLMWNSAQPAILDQQRENIEHNRGFITAQEQVIRRAIVTYNSDTATEGTKKALLNEIWAAAYEVSDNPITDERLGADIRDFLNTHPQFESK